MSRWNEDLRPGEASEGSGYATPDRHQAGPTGFVATRNTPYELALGDIGFVVADYPAPVGSVAWIGRAESAYGPERTKLGEDRICWGHFGVPAAALDAGRAECVRVGVNPADEAAVLALAVARAAERHEARQAAHREQVASLDLARRIQAEAAQSDAAARRLAQVQAHLVAEADGCPTAHKWLRGDPRGNGYGPGPQATEEEIAEAMAAFGGAVPSDDDGRPACKDAYERALWGFIARLAVMLPDGFPGLPGQVQGADGIPTDPLFRTPALALERAKLGKFKGAWQWSCHYREVVDQFQRMSRRGQGECIQEGYQPIPNTLLERAFRVAALR